MPEIDEKLDLMTTAMNALRALARGCSESADILENATILLNGGAFPSSIIKGVAKNDGDTTIAGDMKKLERGLRYQADAVAAFRVCYINALARAQRGEE